MPLSSVLGAQSITKPGVCTSTTRPSSPFDGQVIYETDTDRTLVWNNSAWVAVSYAVYTSSTRPSSPYEGQLIYETDTDRVASYNGSAWVYALGGLVGFANGTSTSAFSANSQVSVLQLTNVPIIAGRRYMVFGTLAVQFSSSNASGKYLFLNVGSSNWTLYHIVNATTANYTATYQGSIFLTASDFGVTSGSGTATFILKWVDNANSGGFSTNPNNAVGANSSLQQLAVFDIGPSSGIISS